MLKNKIVVVSGIGPGLGIKMAVLAAKEGAAGVVLAARTASKLDDAEAAIKKLDLDTMYNAIRQYNISMCGYGAVATAISIGFKKVEIIEHTTSGEKSGDYHAVVGYLSGVLSELT